MAQQPDITKKRTLRLFILALVFALLAAGGTVLYLNILKQKLTKELEPPKQKMTAVVVASSDLAVGTVISSKTVAVRNVPSEYVGPDSITPDQFGSVDGAILTKPLLHGKILLRDFIDLGIPKDFSGTIKEGHRAVTIQVDEINSVSGLIRPGNHIDIFTRLAGGNAAGQRSGIVVPVLEDVLVLATGPASARPNEDEFVHLDEEDRQRQYNTLTLELTPKSVALLSIAESRGTLIAALRNSKDGGGVLFDKVTLQDLLAHSQQLLNDDKKQGRTLQGIHRNAEGQLVSADGTIIKDPNVHLNKDGLLVTKDGTILSGRNLHVGKDGLLHTASGKAIDTASLATAKDGSLIDKNGTKLAGNGYRKTKDGFLVDKNGNVVTSDGTVLQGLKVGTDGLVRTPDGTVVTPAGLTIGKDGSVRLKSPLTDMHVAKDGSVQTADGKTVHATDLVSVGKDGVVRTKDGTILKGVHVGKDGNVVDKNGKILHARDLVTVSPDGVVRTKDGKILPGVHMDRDGILRDGDGNVVTAQDIVAKSALSKIAQSAGKDRLLQGVKAVANPAFARTLDQTAAGDDATLPRLYEVEYITGGQSNGAAKTFKVEIEANNPAGPPQQKEVTK